MTWWTDLPEKVRNWTGLVGVVITLVGGAFAIGATTARSADETAAIPARVEVVEKRVDVLGLRVDSLSGTVEQTRCMVRGLVLDEEDPRDCIFAADGR